METPIDYTELLPQSECPPRDAIAALIEKIPYFSREWLFDTDRFVMVFRDRFVQIVNSLPEDDSRKELEIELAHIQHTLSLHHGLIIAQNETTATLRAIEEELIENWVFEQYQNFSNGGNVWSLVIEEELFSKFLYYLYQYTHYSIQNVFTYLTTLIRFSQIEGSDGIIDSHLRAMYASYDRELVDGMIEQYGYLGGSKFPYNIHIDLAIQNDPELSDREASVIVDDFIEHNARIHILILQLWNKCILPYFNTLEKVDQIYMADALNSLLDILDPEHFIPHFFYNGNYVESMVRGQILIERRMLH